MLALLLYVSILVNTPGYTDPIDGLNNFAQFEGKTISSIEVVRCDVFDDKIREKTPFYYRWGNYLHIITKERVVRNELLFDIGEPVDSLRIIESQRNLRLRGFISEVFVSAESNGPDSVDLTITTIDYWTTKIALFTELNGGDYVFGASASEVNFLGNGQAVEIGGQTTSDEDSYSLFVGDRRLGGTRYAGSFYYTGTTYGDGLIVYFARPQYSLSVRTGFRARYRKTDGIRRMFYDGDEVFRYKRMYREFDSKIIYSRGMLKRIDLYIKYNYEFKDYAPDDFSSPLNYIIPSDETKSYPSLGFGLSIIKYDMQRYLDEAGTPEDLTLGAAVGISLGRSVPEFGADYTGTRPEFSVKFLAKPYSRLFVGAKNKIFWWRHNGQDTEIRSRTEAMVYLKTGVTNVLTARWLTDFAWRQKSTYQLILGGANGLRGYPVYRFSGNRLAIGNLEYRFYLPLEILTVRIGGAAFFDIGNVWQRYEKIDLGDLRSNVGLGLRFGLTKSSTSRVLRFDVAKSLSTNDVYVSFGSTVLFSLRSFENHE
ncbi:MAG: BamA/TamA family outer membrane protein [candidate division Zixibacteria bacterium]